MKPFRVLGYNAEDFCWEVLAEYTREKNAKEKFGEVKEARSHMWVALVLVSGLQLTLIDTNAPNSVHLTSVTGFINAATFRRVTK